MKALVLNCTLKRSPASSSTEALSRVLMRQWEADGVESEIVRLADFRILPGVKTDMGEGDEWPKIHFGAGLWNGRRSLFVMALSPLRSS